MTDKSEVALSRHIKAVTQIFLFGFFLIMINSVWDEWLPYGGYLFFIECLAFCALVAAKSKSLIK